MKIGIVTVHDSNNYGSFLQAYALEKVLEEMGHEVFFAITRDKEYIRSIFIPSITWKQVLKHTRASLRVYRNAKVKREAFLRDQQFFKEIEVDELGKMDLVILGSDEIWNVQVKTFQNDFFYGADLPTVIAYAVSIGNSEPTDFEKYPNIESCIRNIQTIMVRDSKTKLLVESVCGNVPAMVCDPTFLVEKSIFQARDKRFKFLREKYMLIYSYRINQTLKEKIQKFARNNGLKIVSACFYYAWADYNAMCGPLDFCTIIGQAEYVITTTFHGTIFSILNGKQFLSFPISVKTNDLLEQMGLSDRIGEDTMDESEVQMRLKEERIDYGRVFEKINAMRAYSLQMLRQSLEVITENNEEIKGRG